MKKGLALAVQQVLNALITISLIIVIFYILIGSYLDITVLAEGYEEQRKAITLGQILLSYPEVTITKDNRVIRGVFDPTKLDGLATDPDVLYQEILYPNTSYKFKITDKKNGQTWLISPGQIEADVIYDRKFPLTIKYSDNEINPAVMELKFYVNRTPPPGGFYVRYR